MAYKYDNPGRVEGTFVFWCLFVVVFFFFGKSFCSFVIIFVESSFKVPWVLIKSD